MSCLVFFHGSARVVVKHQGASELKTIFPAFALLLFSLHPSTGQTDSEGNVTLEEQRYQEILSIRDETKRIASEMAFLLKVDLNPDVTSLTDTANRIGREYGDTDETIQLEISFFDGISLDELDSLSLHYAIDRLNTAEMHSLDREGMVTKFAVQDVSAWEGTPQTVILHFLTSELNSVRSKINARLLANVSELHLLKKYQDSRLALIHRISIYVKPRLAADVVAAISERRISISATKIPEHAQKALLEPANAVKASLPLSHFRYDDPDNPPMSSTNRKDPLAETVDDVLSQISALSDGVVSFLIPKAHAAVNTSCSGSQCPVSAVWEPDDYHFHSSFQANCSEFPGICNATGYSELWSRFSTSTDPQSPIPVELWAYKNSNTPICVPAFNGSSAPCGSASNPNAVYVPNSAFEHQQNIYDANFICWVQVPIRTGYINDYLKGCLFPSYYVSNLPTPHYLGSTALDFATEFTLEVGTRSGSSLQAGTTYYSRAHFQSLYNLNIRVGDPTHMDVQLLSVILPHLPLGLGEFRVKGASGPTVLWFPGWASW